MQSRGLHAAARACRAFARAPHARGERGGGGKKEEEEETRKKTKKKTAATPKNQPPERAQKADLKNAASWIWRHLWPVRPACEKTRREGPHSDKMQRHRGESAHSRPHRIFFQYKMGRRAWAGGGGAEEEEEEEEEGGGDILSISGNSNDGYCNRDSSKHR